MNNRTSCPREKDIPAYLQQEMNVTVARNGAACDAVPGLRRGASGLFSIIERFQRDPALSVSRDLAPDILEKVARSASRASFVKPLHRIARSPGRRLGLALLFHAAFPGLPILATAGLPTRNPRCHLGEGDGLAAPEPRKQTGRWDSARWGAQRCRTRHHRAGADGADERSGRPCRFQHRDGKGVGLSGLLQQARRRIGKICSGTPYNQGMATLALMDACEAMPGSRWQAAA